LTNGLRLRLRQRDATKKFPLCPQDNHVSGAQMAVIAYAWNKQV